MEEPAAVPLPLRKGSAFREHLRIHLIKPHRKLTTASKQRSFEERLAQRMRSKKIIDAKLRARQAQGKIRRFVNTNFRKQETIASLALRRGECNRCGACCELVFKCPFLKKNPDGTSLCGIYENRPNSCRLFPIEQRDIQEVRGTCSYYFIEKPVRLGRTG
jgi:putative zinc- or iron-chelating protein